MNKDFLKLLAIITHPNNEQKHLDCISKTILHFQRKWYNQSSREEDLLYLDYCFKVNDEFDKLKQRICKTQN